MNARERLMAMIVGVLLACGAIYFIYDAIAGWFDKREQQISQLNQQLEDKQRKLKLANRAVARLRSYEDKSLPSDADLARSLYQTWLLERIDDSEMHDVNVTIPGGARGRQGAFVRHTFEVTGKGNLEQLTTLLYDLHSVDRLHRIQRLTVNPIKDTKDLDIGLTIEALSLAGATATDSLNEKLTDRMRLADVTEYQQIIVGRNLFAAANRAPKLASVGSQKAYLNSRFQVTLKAQDPDKLDSVTYKLLDATLPGATINAKTGELQWTPKEKGEFQAKVVVTDNGLPARSDEQLVKITVNDPPPPPPPPPPSPKKKLDFDGAKFTVLSGITSRNGQLEAWFTVRTTGELLKLKVGQKIQVGSIEGKIAKIEDESVEIATNEDPKTIVINLGSSLVAETSSK